MPGRTLFHAVGAFMSVFEASGAGLSIDAKFIPASRGQSLPLTESRSVADQSKQINPPGQPPVKPADPPQRVLARYCRWARAADVVVAALAATVSVTVRFASIPDTYLLLPVLLPLGWLSAVWLYRGYEHRFIGAGPEEFHRVFRAGMLLFTSVAVLSYLSMGSFSRTIAMISVPFCVIGTMLVRRALRIALHRTRRAGRGLHRTLVVGRSDAPSG